VSVTQDVGHQKTPGSFDLDVNGAANVGGVLTFGTLSSTSLAASTSTITGLTINNSPTSPAAPHAGVSPSMVMTFYIKL